MELYPDSDLCDEHATRVVCAVKAPTTESLANQDVDLGAEIATAADVVWSLPLPSLQTPPCRTLLSHLQNLSTEAKKYT